jgi:hypothetical protein
MDQTPVNIKHHVDAVVANLRASLPSPLKDRVGVAYGGDHEHQTFVTPYVVVHLLGGGNMGGPITDPQVDVQVRIQVNSIGDTAEQAMNTAELVNALMVKSNITITGRAVLKVPKETTSDGIVRDDDISPPLFYAYDVWRLWTTPS